MILSFVPLAFVSFSFFTIRKQMPWSVRLFNKIFLSNRRICLSTNAFGSWSSRPLRSSAQNLLRFRKNLINEQSHWPTLVRRIAWADQHVDLIKGEHICRSHKWPKDNWNSNLPTNFYFPFSLGCRNSGRPVHGSACGAEHPAKDRRHDRQRFPAHLPGLNILLHRNQTSHKS